MIAGFRLVGLAVAGAISLVLLLRSPRIGVVRAFALSSLVIVILGPVVWPWYLATGFALLAATGVSRWRPTYVVLVVTATALVWPSGISPLASVQHVQNGISPFVVAFVIGGVLGRPAGGRPPPGRPGRPTASGAGGRADCRSVGDGPSPQARLIARPPTVTVAPALQLDLVAREGRRRRRRAWCRARPPSGRRSRRSGITKSSGSS